MGVMTDCAVIVTETQAISRVQAIVDTLYGRDSLMEQQAIDQLCTILDVQLTSGNNFCQYFGRKYFCDSEMLIRVNDSNVRKLTADNAEEAIANLRPVGIPYDREYLLNEESAFAYYHNGAPVAFAATHPAGEMSDRIGDIMVGTLQELRSRGYGKAVVSATTSVIVDRGKVAVWGMAHDNMPAMKTASAVGYEQYCEVFELRVVNGKDG
jgi:GNAT superfamily N-acetyltransferase